MKLAAPSQKPVLEMVPNYWLRAMRASPHVTEANFLRALASAALATALLEEPGAKVPVVGKIAVLDALVRQQSDPVFALRLGRSCEVRFGSVLSYILFSSATVGPALANVCDFARLTRPRSRLELINVGYSLEFRLEHPDPAVQAAHAYREFAIGNIVRSFEVATQNPIRPRCVHLAASIGSRADDVGKALGCAVHDGAGHTAIVFSKQVAATRIASSDEL